MSWNLVELSEVKPTPWQNGGGVTRELLALPPGGEWTVRLSVAEVTQDGPFSRLPGVRRWFAVLTGEGVRLWVDGTSHALEPQSPPLNFDGAAQTDCQLLGGSTRDFNLMSRQGSARMGRVHGICARHCKASTLVAAYANGHAVSARWGDERVTISPNSLAWRILDSDGLLELVGEDALWMEIEA